MDLFSEFVVTPPRRQSTSLDILSSWNISTVHEYDTHLHRCVRGWPSMWQRWWENVEIRIVAPLLLLLLSSSMWTTIKCIWNFPRWVLSHSALRVIFNGGKRIRGDLLNCKRKTTVPRRSKTFRALTALTAPRVNQKTSQFNEFVPMDLCAWCRRVYWWLLSNHRIISMMIMRILMKNNQNEKSPRKSPLGITMHWNHHSLASPHSTPRWRTHLNLRFTGSSTLDFRPCWISSQELNARWWSIYRRDILLSI